MPSAPAAVGPPAGEPAPRSLADRLEGRFAHPRVRLLAPLLATFVALPALAFGFFSDDYFLLSLLEQGRVADLYTFATGDPAETAGYIATGPFGWWTDLDLQLRFFRPLGARLLELNWTIFGREPLPYHVEALAWNALIVVAAGLVLRRVLPAATAGLALLLYAVDETRGLPIAWISNHYVLPCAAFGWLAVYAHLRWREGVPIAGPLAALSLAVSLGFGETGLGAAAFILAHTLFASGAGPARTRVRALVPAVVVLAGWVTLYELGGYGAVSSGTYVDPHVDPLRFLSVAPSRLLALLASLLAGFPADTWVLMPPLQPLEAGIGAAATLLAVWAVRRAAPTLAPAELASLRWLLPAVVLALLPVLATFPTDRLLIFPSLAIFALVASLLRWGWHQWAVLTRPVRGWLVVLLFIHGLLPVLSWGAQGLFGYTMLADIERLMDSPALEDVGDRTVILPGVSSPYASMYLVHTRWFRGEGLPQRVWPLTMTPHDLRMTRPDATTLTVEVLDGEMMGTPFEDLFRASGFQVGDVTQLDGATVTVDKLGPHGGPTHLTFRSEVPLDDDKIRVLELHAGQLVRIEVPPPGGSWRARWEPGPGGL